MCTNKQIASVSGLRGYFQHIGQTCQRRRPHSAAAAAVTSYGYFGFGNWPLTSYTKIVILQELTSLLRTMGQNPTDSEVNDMINEVDVDGSGVLDFEEFVVFIKRLTRNRGDPENELREAYRRFVCIVCKPA